MKLLRICSRNKIHFNNYDHIILDCIDCPENKKCCEENWKNFTSYGGIKF